MLVKINQCICLHTIYVLLAHGSSPFPRCRRQLQRRPAGHGEGRSREVLQQLQGQPEGHAEGHVHQGHAPGRHVSHTHDVVHQPLHPYSLSFSRSIQSDGGRDGFISNIVCIDDSVGNTPGKRAKLPLRNIMLPLISGEGQ